MASTRHGLARPGNASRSPGIIARDGRMAGHLAEVMKALGHPARLRIVAVLCAGERCVGDLAQALGLRQAAVSQQLKILRLSGLVAAERRDGFAQYRLAVPRLVQLVQCLEGCPVAERPAGAVR